MSEFNQRNSHDVHTILGDVSHSWGWLMALGALFIVLGTIGVALSVAMTVVTVLFFGVLVFVGGVLQLIDTFKCKGWKSIMAHILIAILYLVAGIILITEPVVGSMAITAVLAAAFIVIGLLRIFMGVQLRGFGLAWGWLVLAGLVSMTLGTMIFLQWPESALWFIGLVIAIEMIFHGWAYVMFALVARSFK